MNVEGICPGSEARDELDHGQPSPPESTNVNATIGELEGLVGADFQTCAQRRRG